MGTDCRICECIKAPPQKSRKPKKCPNHLDNWEKWLKIRKDTQESLKKKIGRPQGELLMNLSEELRQIQEEKLVFAYSQINTNFDRFRGNPEFWKLPVGLVEKFPNHRHPIYFTVKTKEEKNEVPQIEYVGIPNNILDEKHVVPRLRNIYNKWKNNAYRNSCIKKIASHLSLIQPHLPDISQLIVKGKTLSVKNTELRSSVKQTELTGTNNMFSFKGKHSFEVHEFPDIFFSINNVALSNNNHSTGYQQQTRVLFKTEDLQNTPVLNTVKLENKGTKTMRFYWHKVKQFRMFRDIVPDRSDINAFYFDKTEILLVPGRELQLPIWFKPEETGHYTECWEIKISPNVWNEDFKFIIRLQGFVADENIDAECKAIKDMLSNNVRHTLIKDILNENMNRMKYSDSEPIVFTFSEKEIFESANQETLGIMKRPKYLYDQNVLNELKEFHNKVKKVDSAQNWDYSIETLKLLAREKDVVEYVMKLTDDCARSRNRLLQLGGIVEPSDIDTKNPSSGNDELETTENNYKQLQFFIHKLERPAMIPNTEREKFLHAYFIMSSYFSKMSVALDTLGGNTVDIIKNYQPFYDYRKITTIEDLPSRLVFEKFDDIWIERTKRAPKEPQTGFVMTPKPKCLESIPLEDTKTIFNAYFKNTPQNPDKKLKKTSKKTSSIPLAKELSKSKPNNSKISQTITIGPIRENFDPFGDIESIYPYTGNVTESIVNSLTPEQEPKLDRIVEEHTVYDYRKYLIVYTNLCSAVDAMVASLETLKEHVVPLTTFAEVNRVLTKRKEEPECSERSSEDPYFQYLLDTHLINNQATTDYFIHGRTAPSVEEVSVQEEPIIVEELPNLFKSYESVVVEPIESRSTLVSQGIQTSYPDMNLRIVSEDVPMTEPLTNEVENIVDSEEQTEIFYFMDNETVDKCIKDAH